MPKLRTYGNFIKIEHTLFSLPIILSGAFLAAGGLPELGTLLLILIAGAGARTGALGLNRIIDNRIDKLNPRTKDRELPSDKISNLESILITVGGLLVYFICAYLICELVFYLSPIPVIVFVIYPYLKRVTPLCHFGVGLALALAPLGGWVAVTCSLNNLFPAILLSVFTLCWVAGFDIIYATLDEKFDIEHKIYSMVSVFGRKKALGYSLILHILAFLSLCFVYILKFRNLSSFVALVVIGILLYLEYRKSSDVDLAFFKINIVIGAFTFIFILGGIYLP